MFDLAQHLIISSDLSVLNPSTVNFAYNFHLNIADIHSSINMDLLAQQFNQDVMGDLGKGWNKFVSTGQIWALMIGIIVGYLFRSVTNA